MSDLVERGLRPPLLGISDGAPGLIAALETTFRQSLRQRCLIHRCRNIVAKVPKGAEAEVKAGFWAIFDDIDEEPGDPAVKEATRRAGLFATRYAKVYPAAVACLEDDLASLTVHLRFPAPALEADPAFELYRAHLRRDTPARQGHRPLAR